MDCVVTGGAGFIGSHLVDALLARGDRVTVLDSLVTGKRENLAPEARLETLDLRETERVMRAFEAARPEVVFHLAAQVDVRSSVRDPVNDAAVNVLGTIAVLEAARATGVRRLVNTSTGGGLYGDAEVLPTPEAPPIRPLAPYGQGKLTAEGYCELYERLHGFSTISLRYGNVYGPRQDSHGEAGVVAIFCAQLQEARRPTVFGDGRQTRDWVEVADVVEANLLAAASELRGPVNIGTGAETSVLELLRALGELRGDAVDPEFAPERLGEVRRSCLAVNRARDELGWEARVSLRDGLQRMLAA